MWTVWRKSLAFLPSVSSSRGFLFPLFRFVFVKFANFFTGKLLESKIKKEEKKKKRRRRFRHQSRRLTSSRKAFSPLSRQVRGKA